MRHVLFAVALLFASQASAQINWDWEVLDTGCYILDPNGTPTKYCLEYWDSRDDHSINPATCAGPCSFNATLGETVCNFAPLMSEEITGPDLHAETPAVMPPTDPVNDPGNQTRRRWLKCVRTNKCKCEQQASGAVFCKVDNQVPPVYQHATTFQGDLNGPACEPDQQQQPPG